MVESSDSLFSNDGKIVATRWLDNRALNTGLEFYRCWGGGNSTALEQDGQTCHWCATPSCSQSVQPKHGRCRQNGLPCCLVQDCNLVQKVDSQNNFSFCESWCCELLVRVQTWCRCARRASSNQQLDLLDFTLRITDALAKKEKKCKITKRGRPSLPPLEPTKLHGR